MKASPFEKKRATPLFPCDYFAYSVLRVSRITFTRICPGYSICSSAALNRIALVHAVEAVRNLFQLLQPLDVVLNALAAGAGPRGGNRVRRLHQHRFHGLGFNVVVVRHDAVNNVVVLVVFPGQLGAQGHVRAFALVVNGLADVMQQSGALGQLHVRAQLRGHQARQVAHLDAVLQHVLAVRSPEPQPPQQLHQLVVNAVLVRFENGVLAGFADLVVNFLPRAG